MNKIIVGFHGHAGAGKDTAAGFLIRKLGFVRLAFADPLKIAAKAIFGLTDAQLWGGDKEKIDPYWKVSAREILQRMGTECMRVGFADDIWIKALFRQVQDLERIVITDVRFPNEAAAIKEAGGVLVKIERPGAPGSNMSHVSENALRDWSFDHVIVNDGSVEDLSRAVLYALSGLDKAA